MASNDDARDEFREKWIYSWDEDPDWVNPERENFTKSDEPYRYSEFFLWRFGGRYTKRGWNFGKNVHSDYSDRLQQWDYAKWNRAVEGLGRIDSWGQDGCSKVLTAYFGKPIEAIALAEGCNISNGYPYWIFWYRLK